MNEKFMASENKSHTLKCSPLDEVAPAGIRIPNTPYVSNKKPCRSVAHRFLSVVSFNRKSSGFLTERQIDTPNNQ